MGPRTKPKYQLFPTEVAAAWDRDPACLTPLELFRVAAWKSAKSLAPLTLNTEADIAERTAHAMREITSLRGRVVVGLDDDATWAEWCDAARRAIGDASTGTGLLGLEGVGYPVATAILCALDPIVWPVMDRWAAQTVFAGKKSDWKHAAAYAAYARHLATQGAFHWGDQRSIHELDLKAMNAAMPDGELPKGWQRIECPPRLASGA